MDLKKLCANERMVSLISPFALASVINLFTLHVASSANIAAVLVLLLICLFDCAYLIVY